MYRLLLPVLLVWILVPLTQATGDIIYDLEDDYSSTVNTDTSLWSYRFGTDSIGRVGNYSLLDTAPGSGADSGFTYNPLGTPMPVWNADSTSIFPFVGKNETGVAQSAPAAFTWNPDDVIFHPNTGNFVVASWLSPNNGMIDVSFQFTKAQDPDGGDGIAWFVEVNDQTATISSGTLGGNVGETSGLLSFSDISVNAGDRVNFIVQSVGTLFRDTTQVEATISASPVPEPSTFLAAPLCLFLLRRRESRSR